ncbi:MAG: aldo/keto reductase [Spirochaetaceae bacterium]|nr:MAG: aldo/keto reductase [Spirochaetaceae bacterium]
MEKRVLGNTGLQLSVIGFGGFHLVEVPRKEVSLLLNTYLDRGGNYIETAAQYGDGVSERKVGEAVSHRRSEFVLATKAVDRTRDGAMTSLERSLKNLRSDHVDLFFMHEPQSVEEAKKILAPGGAMEAFTEAKQAGKARYVAVSGHGRPAGIQYSIENHAYDVLMTGFNYFDRFNFPQTEEQLLPLCLDRGVGVLGMKALADGYLYRNVATGIRYALSLPIASLVLGMNRLDHLEQDLKVAETFTPMGKEEKEELYRNAPELGRYVCRQCGRCRGADGIDPEEIFLLEGLFDRQMNDYTVPDPQEYALRERLKHWFDQKDWAQEQYGKLRNKVDPQQDYSALNDLCTYGIDVDRKLKIAHSKLTGGSYLF